MKYFKKTTVLTEKPDDINVVIMWRKTWESIPEKFRPLPGRINCVLTRNPPHIPPSQGGENQGCVYFESLDSCLEEIENMKNIWKVFIIWWAQIYNQVLWDSRLEKIYLTRVKWDFSCDVFFDGIPSNFEQEWSSEAIIEWWIEYQFEVWKQK
jgi:dihydrofolate reductase